MSFTSDFFQTVSCTLMYISFSPDRLFKTDGEQLIVHWFLWWYVIIMPGCSGYVLYINSIDTSFFVGIAQETGLKSAY